MSTVLDDSPGVTTDPAERLQTTCAAVRVCFHWLGVRRSLTDHQKSQAAEPFGAEGKFLSAGKKLLDTKHPAWKELTAVRGRILSYWRGDTLPYPDPGFRLIRQDRVSPFDQRMRIFRDELGEAVWRLDEHYEEIKSAARDRLGSLFDLSDYPLSLDGLFQVYWDFPSVEPPSYLMQLNPELFRQESERVRQRFNEAVDMAEEAFTSELSKLVAHLTERLSSGADGQQKVFRDSAVANLNDFFSRFRELNIGSSEQLDTLVDQAQGIMGGVSPSQLRANGSLRQNVAMELSRVQSVLDGLMVDRPRRNILRRPK